MNWKEATWNSDLSATPREFYRYVKKERYLTYSLTDAIAKHTEKINIE